MLSYVGHRLAYVLCIVGIMSVLVFAATHVLPGSAAVMILGEYASPDALAAIEAKLGLTDPLLVQYGRWAGGFLVGDFGQSLVLERPVAPMVWEALGRSAVLALAAMLFVTVLGLGSGVLSAVERGRPLDYVLSIISYVGISVPEFFWGVVFVLIFAASLGWFPTNGYMSIAESPLGFIAHLVLPVATLTLTLVAHVSRLTRSSMIEVLQSPYIKAARARGLPERRIVMGHALRNGLLPSITVLAHDFGWLIGGIVVIETVFAYPGIGRLLIFAIERHDLPLMQAIILISTTLFALVNLLADLLYAYFNPRIRYGRSVA